ncbi:magnesium chelatase subunit D [Pseudorhodoferax sp. Leaf274]|uniref:magnesium chelatase subunit D n=1 Tax=Pseudorhodoferax sp. Leaf274 TaxID=1736318 RepID=UPI000AC69462|nr:magnesium chelatase subunit D [Pseudorhodoferax sp. Leaf274]
MSASAWAACLLALDPAGLGGVVLRGGPGPARDALVAQWQSLRAPGTPWRRCPLQIDDARLLGGLDLGLSVAAGRPVAQAGLLAEVRGGVLVLPMAERVPTALAGRLAQALDGGGFSVLALDEGATPDERVATCLGERLALVVDSPLASSADWPAAPPPSALAKALHHLRALPFDAEGAEALCACAQALGIVGLRAPWQAWRAACAVAAWRGHAEVMQDDAELAARLVLAPRARALPPAEQATTAPPAAEPPAADPPVDPAAQPPASADAPAAPPSEAAPAHSAAPAPPPREEHAQPLPDRLIAAAQSAIPPDLLALLAAGLAPQRGTAAGRQGVATRSASSGRPMPPRRGAPRGAQRLDLLATLRAALPWQALRRQERAQLALPPTRARWLVRRDDFHCRRHRRPAETTTVFVVDASGSQALHRLAEAKGAVELLLADCYVRRDRVALIAFRGTAAELLLPPTRSLVRAKRALTELPGGGGTPLAAGIEAGWQLAAGLQAREGARAQLVFLTDGRANVDRQGRGGRPGAMADAQQMARRLAGAGIASLLIDTSVRPQPESAALARQMGARYLALPQGRAELLHRAIGAAL